MEGHSGGHDGRPTREHERGGGGTPRDFADLGRGGRGGGKGGRGDGKGGGRAGGLPAGGRYGDGNENAGFISSLKENFGFIERARDAAGAGGAGENIFFHFSALCGYAGPSVGDEVSYTVVADRRTGRNAAMRVTPLPKGTLPPPPRPVNVRAVVQRELRGGHGAEGYGGRLAIVPESSAAEAPPAGGAGAQSAPGVEVLHFDGRNCERGAQFSVGDLVECELSTAPAASGASPAPQHTVSRVRLVKRGGGLPRERGMVISLKDKFGFIRSEVTPGELFFHFSEAPRPDETGARAEGLVRSEPSLRVGDEVSFVRVTDPRSQKEAGTRLAVLPPGIVSFETVEDAVLRGVVTRGVAGSDRPARMLLRRDKAQQGGILRLISAPEGPDAAPGGGVEAQAADEAVEVAHAREPSEAVGDLSLADGESGGQSAVDTTGAPFGRGGRGSATFCFGLDDVEAASRPAGLYVGDEVMFRRATDRATGDVGAAHVVLVTADWQRGFVTSMREQEGGTVRPAAGGAALPFAQVSAACGLRVGSEVEYRRSTDPRTRRPCAACVRELPPGTILLEWVWPVRWEAVLVSAPARGAPQTGRKAHQTGGGAEAAGLVELKRPLVREAQSAQGGDSAEAAGPIELEMGQARVPDALVAGTRAGGASGEGSAVAGGAAGGRGGTDDTRGTGGAALATAEPETAALRAIASLAGGCGGASLPLPPSVLADPRTSLSPGDTLSVQIAISAADGALRACRALLLAPAPGACERGMVTSAKHDFGFLRAEGRAGVFFFHYSELPTRTHQVRTGDEFEFVVSTTPAAGSTGVGGAAAAAVAVAPNKKGRPTAIRLRPLLPGTVRFEDVLIEAATGVVEMGGTGGGGDAAAAAEEAEADEEGEWPEEAGTTPAAAGSAESAGGGASSGAAGVLLVRLDQEYAGERLALPPSRRELDVYLRGALPAAGCTITCRLAQRKRDGKLVLIDVHPVPLAGTIRTCHGATGAIRAAAPLPPAAIEAAEKARTADAASQQAAAADTSGLQDLVGSGATWGRAELGAAADEDGRVGSAAAAGGPLAAPVAATAAAVYISAGQSPFANAAPTVKTTHSRLAELAATHGDGRSQQVPFGFGDTVLDPKKEARLGVGDEVEFVLCCDPKTLQLVARRVRLIKEAVEPEPPEYTKRQVDPTKMTRFAKGPDGTRGFAVGRGKGLTPASAGAAET